MRLEEFPRCAEIATSNIWGWVRRWCLGWKTKKVRASAIKFVVLINNGLGEYESTRGSWLLDFVFRVERVENFKLNLHAAGCFCHSPVTEKKKAK